MVGFGKERAFEGGDCRLFACGIERLAQQQKARGMIGDGRWITVLAIAELELALEVSAALLIGHGGPATAAGRARWRGPPLRLTRP